MASLDANILVRFLVHDDATQLAAAKRLLNSAIAAGEPLYVPITVSLELEWVLRSNFGFSKTEVIQTLSSLLTTSELLFESESALEIALSHYGRAAAAFSDRVHVALAAQGGHAPLWTFDKAAAKLDGARLLSTA